MESIRIDVSYRPVRIAWAIRAGDVQAFRSAVRKSYAFWGGRFNPIVVVDREREAADLADLFRVDVIVPVGDSDAVQAFPKRFGHLITPYFRNQLFVGEGEYGSPAQLLDIHNAMSYAQSKPEFESVKKRGVRLYKWEPDDPLADVLLVHLGDYPSLEETSIQYRGIATMAADATEIEISATVKLPAETFEHPSIAFLSRYGLRPHYRIPTGWNTPGFFSGDASNLDDLITFWNLRAADIPVFFVDPNHLDRCGDTFNAWEKAVRPIVSGRRFDFDRGLALWARMDEANNTEEGLREITKPFEGKIGSVNRIFSSSWSGGAVRPPTMHFDEVSALGIVGYATGSPTVSFALDKKPFNGDTWFHSQTLVASLSFIGGLYGDERQTFVPPYVPELNEFYSRSMAFDHRKLRSEPGGIGIIIGASDKSVSVRALAVGDLVERIFDLAGFSSHLSEGGLITRQLIAQLGGVDGARAFKIPGVRRLLKTYGPNEAFTKKGAVHLIGSRDPENAGVSFKDHENLYIERRSPGTQLTPAAVFSFLVEKGLFRIGAELSCPNCRLPSWTALDALKQRVVCDLCGQEFDATRQLMNEDWRYRRSGVLGKERNAQGAVPVVLTLQQLKVNLGGLFYESMYSPSLELVPKPETELPECEVDFVWLIPPRYPERTVVMIGECKDRGGARKKGKDPGTIDA
jgi:hypothetical protein